MILEATSDNIDHCASLLQSGEIVGIPTETVYGLAGNALRESSVRKIFQVKSRPFTDPLIVHCSHLKAVESIAFCNDSVYRLAEAFWPGPLTLILAKDKKIPDIVTAGLNSVAVRVPQHPVFRSVLEKIDFPLAAPSANPFGYVSPTLAEHVQQTLGSKVNAILDGGPCRVGLESTILDLRNLKVPVVLRHGPITCSQISNCLGLSVKTVVTEKSDEKIAQSAPGQLTKHYSPKASVYLIEHGSTRYENPIVLRSDNTEALVCNQKPEWYEGQQNIYWLSKTGDPDEIAHNLFDLVQKLDRQQFSKIFIERVPSQSIGLAINDRMERAAANS